MELKEDLHLHIVSFAIPFPPDYGGAIDVYYRIKCLSQLGVKIHLHCYDYRGEKHWELEQLCYEVHYYTRKLGLKSQFSFLPYIVSSRMNKELHDNLVKVEAPILFEGLHTIFNINHPSLKARTKVVRAHNIEHEYYWHLGTINKNLWKKLYFFLDALKLRLYEKNLKYASVVAAISLKDYNYFLKKFDNTVFLPASHPFNKVESEVGFGKYILFQANLQVSENIQIAEWIIGNIAPLIKYPIIIAGKNPPEKLINMVQPYSNIEIFANPDQIKMNQLITEAHIHLLPIFKSSGLKLKLLYALFLGRYCIVNDMMLEGTRLENACTIANTPEEMIEAINQLFQKPFDQDQINHRNNILAQYYNNTENAKKLVQLLFG